MARAPVHHGRHRALVAGASIGGLLAAGVLADHYEEVIVVERDDLPSGPASRRGVPQGRQLHLLMKRGGLVLADLFPGLPDELLAAGAVTFRMAEQMRVVTPSGLIPGVAVCDDNIGVARPLLEHAIRGRVAALDGVALRSLTSVTGVTSDGKRVTGVTLSDKSTGEATQIETDLVVDASGRAGQGAVWLESLGFAPPAVETVRVDVGYATHRVRMAGPDDYRMMLVLPSAERPAGVAAAAVSGDLWMVTLYGYGSHQPSSDPADFIPQLTQLAPADLVTAVSGGEVLADQPRSHRFPSAIRRRYDRLDRLPSGLVSIGDAVSSFNPVYGQGMTVAARGAEHLRHWLDEGSDRPERFYRQLSRTVKAAWDLSTGADYELQVVEGRPPLDARLIGPYMSRFLKLAVDDEDAALAFLRVISMLDEPSALLRPRLAAKVARHGLRDVAARWTRAGDGASEPLTSRS